MGTVSAAALPRVHYFWELVTKVPNRQVYIRFDSLLKYLKLNSKLIWLACKSCDTQSRN